MPINPHYPHDNIKIIIVKYSIFFMGGHFMKIKKIISMILTVFLFVLSFSACSGGKGGNKLVVYYISGDETSEMIISTFKSTYSSISLDAKSFVNAQQMDDTLRNELKGGNGPDVVLFTDKTSLDVIHLAANGTFAPLDEFLKNDKTYTAEKYMSGALDAGKINNQQIFIPAKFKLYSLLYDKKTADDLSLPTTTVVNADKVYSAVQTQMNKSLNANQITLYMQDANLLSDLYRISQVQVLSNDHSQVQIDDSNLKKIVDWAKTFRNEQEKSSKVAGAEGSDSWDVGASSSFVLWNGKNLGYDAWGYDSVYKANGAKEVGISSIASLDGQHSSAYLTVFGAVTKHAASNKSAFTFLRSMMDLNEKREKNDTKVSDYDMTTNKSLSTEYLLDLMSKSESMQVGDKSMTIAPLSSQSEQRVTDILANLGKFSICNSQIETLLEESFAPYIFGGSTYEYCLDDFKGKLEKYIKQ